MTDISEIVDFQKSFATCSGTGSHLSLNDKIDDLLAAINFQTEEETLLPENVETIKIAFENFLKAADWPMAAASFQELLKEKSGKHAFRKDGKTPDWFHEFQNVLCYLVRIKAGLLRPEELNRFGGPEVGVSIALRHDSWEDFGKSPMQIYAPLEKLFHDLMDQDQVTENEGQSLRHKAVVVSQGVDLLTRQVPRICDDGSFARTDTGKLIKDERYGGDMNLYVNALLGNPHSVLVKFDDAIWGMATRIGVNSFSIQDNKKYARERRGIFGRRQTDTQAVQKWPFLKEAIPATDGMLGILLVVMETINDYDSDHRQNPENAFPIRIQQYLPQAMSGYRHLPHAFRPDLVLIGRLEARAVREPRIRALLDKAIYPAILAHYPQDCLPKALDERLSCTAMGDSIPLCSTPSP